MNRAKGELEALSEWLADDMSWTLIEKSTHSGPSAAREVRPPFSERVEVISVVTHGRRASCDGYLEAGGMRVRFSHAFRFVSTPKTAMIAELRRYCIETQVD